MSPCQRNSLELTSGSTAKGPRRPDGQGKTDARTKRAEMLGRGSPAGLTLMGKWVVWYRSCLSELSKLEI